MLNKDLGGHTKVLQKILVFQQNGSGESKIQGIRKYGKDRFDIHIISIDSPLPPVIDDETKDYLPCDIRADLVLDFLKHPDLSHDLTVMCRNRKIPVVASGKKLHVEWPFTPLTWCALSRQVCLGLYGQEFGAPEFDVEIDDGMVVCARVLRGAPCGATWEAAKQIAGLPVKEAGVRIGLETQFFCTANPAGWDPIYGKSPVHFAGHLHQAAFIKALKQDI